MSSHNQLSNERVIRIVQRPRSYVIERHSLTDPSAPEYWSNNYGWLPWGGDQKRMPSFFRRLEMAQAVASVLPGAAEVEVVQER